MAGAQQILALDVGTSSVKAAVLDVASGQPLGPIARAAYDLDQPTPDQATIAPERLLAAVLQAGREAAQGRRVEGLGFSCLTPALLLLDDGGRPLTPLVTHLDRRSRPEARQVQAEVGPEFLKEAGNRPLPGGVSAVFFRHFARRWPDLARKTRRYLHANGWLGLEFTGQTAFDLGNACFTGLFDPFVSRAWSPRWCEYFGVSPEWLPPVVSGETTLGGLRTEVACALGVAAGIPVKLGTADTSSAMLAAGLKAGDLLHVVGTTQVLAAHAPRPRPSPRRLTRFLGVGDRFIHVAHNPVGGAALGWMHHLCFRDQTETEYFSQTVLAACSRPTAVVLDPPFLGGDRLEIEPSFAAFGNLALGVDRMDLLAAVLEAMRRRHGEALLALDLETPVRSVFLSGGGAEIVRNLIPAYDQGNVQIIEEASLRGVARLFWESDLPGRDLGPKKH